jgi:hypothetical protein
MFLTLNQALAMSPINMAIVMHPLGPQLVRLLPNGGTKVVLTKLDGDTRVIEMTPEGHDGSNRTFTLRNINCRPIMDELEADAIQNMPIQLARKEKHSHCQIFICTKCQVVGHLPTSEKKEENLIKRVSEAHHEHSPKCLQPTPWIRIISCKDTATQDDIPEWALLPIAQFFEEGEKIIPKDDNAHPTQIYFCKECRTVNYVEVSPDDNEHSIRQKINKVHKRDASACDNIYGLISLLSRKASHSKYGIETSTDIPSWAKEPIITLLGIKETDYA